MKKMYHIGCLICNDKMRKKLLLQIRLDEHHKFLLDEVCHKENVTASEKVRELIQLHFQSLNQENSNNLKKNMKKHTPQWNPNEKQRKLTTGEMYSGPGGIGLALKESKFNAKGFDLSFEHLWATDYDADTCLTYKNNLLQKNSDAISICEDIRKINIKDLPIVDGFLYGFPCNDFSIVGETKGLKGEFGPLYKYGVEYINHANPLFIFAENVSGLGSANSGNAFKEILKELNHAGKYGYNLSVHLYKFEEYGIPQARHRFIVIGTRGDLNINFNVPKPSLNFKSCKDAIEIPPISPNCANNELTKQSVNVIERLKHTKPGENAWTANLPEHLKLNVKGAKLSQIYKRLDPSKPSYTITGSGGGGTHVYHWKENRALTNRERARLQTFPDSFVFYGTKESVRSQIGMAVPVEGVKIILQALLKSFSNEKYQSIEPSHGKFISKTL
jgi:DNA (cytosine-5)-methyltransferase 1